MRELIQELRRNTTRDKILITQNGNELYFRDGKLDDTLFSLTQGSTQEDLYYESENFPERTKENVNLLTSLTESRKSHF